MDIQKVTIEGERVTLTLTGVDIPLPDLPETQGMVIDRVLVHLGKPSIEAELQGKLDELAAQLPDDLAVQHPGIYPELLGDGQAILAGQRWRVGSDLYRAQVTVWDRPDQWPDEAPDLWRLITASGSIEDWIQPTGAHDAYHLGDIRAHVGKVWRSTVKNGAAGEPLNTWEPGVFGWEVYTP